MTTLAIRNNGIKNHRSPFMWDPFDVVKGVMGEPSGLGRLGAPSKGIRPSQFSPSFDVIEKGDSYIIKADMPGIKEDDIEITVTGGELTVSGSRKAEERHEGEGYYMHERAHGSFLRTFTLPSSVDADSIEADLQNGELTVTAPKRAEAKPKKIPIGT